MTTPSEFSVLQHRWNALCHASSVGVEMETLLALGWKNLLFRSFPISAQAQHDEIVTLFLCYFLSRAAPDSSSSTSCNMNGLHTNLPVLACHTRAQVLAICPQLELMWTQMQREIFAETITVEHVHLINRVLRSNLMKQNPEMRFSMCQFIQGWIEARLAKDPDDALFLSMFDQWTLMGLTDIWSRIRKESASGLRRMLNKQRMISTCHQLWIHLTNLTPKYNPSHQWKEREGCLLGLDAILESITETTDNAFFDQSLFQTIVYTSFQSDQSSVRQLSAKLLVNRSRMDDSAEDTYRKSVATLNELPSNHEVDGLLQTCFALTNMLAISFLNQDWAVHFGAVLQRLLQHEASSIRQITSNIIGNLIRRCCCSSLSNSTAQEDKENREQLAQKLLFDQLILWITQSCTTEQMSWQYQEGVLFCMETTLKQLLYHLSGASFYHALSSSFVTSRLDSLEIGEFDPPFPSLGYHIYQKKRNAEEDWLEAGVKPAFSSSRFLEQKESVFIPDLIQWFDFVVQCMKQSTFELQRFTDQLLPILVQVIIWKNPLLLIHWIEQSIETFHESTDNQSQEQHVVIFWFVGKCILSYSRYLKEIVHHFEQQSSKVTIPKHVQHNITLIKQQFLKSILSLWDAMVTIPIQKKDSISMSMEIMMLMCIEYHEEVHLHQRCCNAMLIQLSNIFNMNCPSSPDQRPDPRCSSLALESTLCTQMIRLLPSFCLSIQSMENRLSYLPLLLYWLESREMLLWRSINKLEGHILLLDSMAWIIRDGLEGIDRRVCEKGIQFLIQNLFTVPDADDRVARGIKVLRMNLVLSFLAQGAFTSASSDSTLLVKLLNVITDEFGKCRQQQESSSTTHSLDPQDGHEDGGDWDDWDEDGEPDATMINHLACPEQALDDLRHFSQHIWLQLQENEHIDLRKIIGMEHYDQFQRWFQSQE